MAVSNKGGPPWRAFPNESGFEGYFRRLGLALISASVITSILICPLLVILLGCLYLPVWAIAKHDESIKQRAVNFWEPGDVAGVGCFLVFLWLPLTIGVIGWLVGREDARAAMLLLAIGVPLALLMQPYGVRSQPTDTLD